MNWIFYALLASFLWAFGNILDKILVTKYIKNPPILVIFIGITSLLATTILILFKGISFPTTLILLIALLTGIFHLIGLLPYFLSLSFEEVSRVIPLWLFSPIFVLIISVLFLGETLNFYKYLAFSLIFLGGILISSKEILGTFKLSRAFWLMLFSSIIMAIYYIFVKYVFLKEPFWNGFIWINIGFFLGVLFLIPIYGQDFIKNVKTLTKKSLSLLFSLEILGFSGMLSSYYAIMLGLVSLVIVLEGFQPLFVLIFALFLSLCFPKILLEKINKKIILTKILAIFLMLLGLYFLYK